MLLSPHGQATCKTFNDKPGSGNEAISLTPTKGGHTSYFHSFCRFSAATGHETMFGTAAL
jgi:hypothetical protein